MRPKKQERLEELRAEVKLLSKMYWKAVKELKAYEKNIEAEPMRVEDNDGSIINFDEVEDKPKQESVVMGDAPFFGNKCQWVLRYTKSNGIQYACNCATVSSLVFPIPKEEGLSETLVVLRSYTVDHYDTEEEMLSLTESQAEDYEISFPSNHPLAEKTPVKVFVNSCATNQMLAEIWMCFRITGLTNSAKYKTEVLDQYVIESERTDSAKIGDKVKVSTLGTETHISVVSTGRISRLVGVGGDNGETVKAVTYDCSVVNPDARDCPQIQQGGGSSGSLVYVSSNNGKYKPYAMHFGGAGTPLRNQGYTIPLAIPKTPKEVSSYINSVVTETLLS